MKVTINLSGADEGDKSRFRHPVLPATLEAIRAAIGNQQALIEIQWGPRRQPVVYDASDNCTDKPLSKADVAEVPASEHVRKSSLQIGPSAHVGQLLRAKFGKLPTEELRLCIGGECSNSAFSSAMAGKGARKIRVLIALALNILPSKLWAERSYPIKRMDDQDYLLRQQQKGTLRS